jgi:hypothetical protein
VPSPHHLISTLSLLSRESADGAIFSPSGIELL